MQKRSQELDATYWQHDAQWEGQANKKKYDAQAEANGGFRGPFEP